MKSFFIGFSLKLYVYNRLRPNSRIYNLNLGSTVIQRDFCSHALTDCLYAFIHRGFRYGSKCGSRCESKWLLSLFHISLSVICLILSFESQDVNI